MLLINYINLLEEIKEMISMSKFVPHDTTNDVPRDEDNGGIITMKESVARLILSSSYLN